MGCIQDTERSSHCRVPQKSMMPRCIARWCAHSLVPWLLLRPSPPKEEPACLAVDNLLQVRRDINTRHIPAAPLCNQHPLCSFDPLQHWAAGAAWELNPQQAPLHS
jgi:hypothetical protein